MKHSVKVTIILIIMFFIAQLIGLYVSSVYLPQTETVVVKETGEVKNLTVYNLPYGIEPPEETKPSQAIYMIIFAMFFAVVLMMILMKFKAETFLRLWFFFVVILGIAIALNAFIINIAYSALIAFVVAIPLAYLKIFKRNLIVHNVTEALIYPGIASVFIPLLSIWSAVILLVIISIYDIYAVWHAGFMQKMAKYQIEKLKIFSGFFIPYASKEEKVEIKKIKEKKSKKKISVNIAILGGGDVVFPILLSGVVLRTLGFLPALLIAISATIALSFLLFLSEKGKFYPAMPFISAGCFIALAIGYLIS